MRKKLYPKNFLSSKQTLPDPKSFPALEGEKSNSITKLEKSILASLTQKEGFLSPLFISWNWLLIALAIVLSEQVQIWWFYILTVCFIGTRMIALVEVFGHDSVHNNLFKQKSLNRILDFLWFLPVFETWESYKKEHTNHHRYLLTPKDPAWQDYKRWGLYNKNHSKKRVFWIWFVRPFLCFDSLHLLKTILSHLWKDKLYRRKILTFWSLVLLLAASLQSLDILLLYWIVPLFWAYPALVFWGEVGEHYGVQGNPTRNTFGFLEWAVISPHNDRFHYVHHRYPRIPWYKIKKAYHVLFKDEGTPSSSSFLDLYRQIDQKALALPKPSL